MTPGQLYDSLRPLLPGRLSLECFDMDEELHVHIGDGVGSYNLTISRPDEPISVENIVARAKEIFG
jgi:hypothetical protein